MLSTTFVYDQLKDTALSCCPSVENASQIVKDIYASAVDFFGEERVDLQKMEDNRMWQYVLESRSVDGLLKLFGIPKELFPHPASDFYSVLWDEKRLMEFLGLITTDRIQTGSLPVYCIVVHFHDITVSNNRGDSTQIEDIYSSTCISYGGYHSLLDLWSRTTMSTSHYRSGYRHSHLPVHRGPEWSRPCFGNGPITMTMDTLYSTPDTNFWNLFWLELDKCIRVESTEGGPYIYIRSASNKNSVKDRFNYFRFVNMYSFTGPPYSTIFDEVALMLLQSAQLQYAFRSNTICIVTPFEDFTVMASNCVLSCLQQLHEQESEKAEQLASQLFGDKWVFSGQITTDGHILSYGDKFPTTIPPDRPAGFSFKGTPVTFKVVDSVEDQSPFYYLLHPAVTGYLKNKLTVLINNIYARKRPNHSSKTRTH